VLLRILMVAAVLPLVAQEGCTGLDLGSLALVFLQAAASIIIPLIVNLIFPGAGALTTI